MILASFDTPFGRMKSFGGFRSASGRDGASTSSAGWELVSFAAFRDLVARGILAVARYNPESRIRSICRNDAVENYASTACALMRSDASRN